VLATGNKPQFRRNTLDTVFSSFETIRYEGPASENDLAYRWYDPTKIVRGKPLSDHLRFAMAYWHSLGMNGSDPFGGPTINRPWSAPGDSMTQARIKADAAFDLLRVLDIPFFTFHDRDVVHEGESLSGTLKNLSQMKEYFAEKMESSGTRLLWGTANLFSHPRFMAGASTNPDPDVFAWCAATVKHCMDVTRELGGANYVLWGGREGYETLLNTDMKQELDQMGRFLTLVVEYKHKSGFKGQILVEPKPKEPTVHQYDFDTATVYAFLQHYGLEKEIRVNIEANHALLAGHTFEHEIATAGAFGILGSLDINRGDPLLGWDTDQFPNDPQSMTMAMYQVIKAGGLGQGGCNFDAKVRRQSFTPEDLLYAHIGAIDICAHGFILADKLIADGKYDDTIASRYEDWKKPENAAMLNGALSLEEIAAAAESRNINPQPKSGRQELIENRLQRLVTSEVDSSAEAAVAFM
jgi:xylose isomerase